MTVFVKRIISGVIYVILFLSAILFSEKSYIVLLTLFAGVCLWEFLRIIASKNPIPYIVLAFLSYLLLLKPYILVKENQILFYSVIYSIVCASILILKLFDKENRPTSKLNLFLSPIKYIVLPFFFLMALPFLEGIYHPYIIIYTVLIIWVNDSFAYLVGKNFGRNKLFERISPKKTLEGFIGGLVFSIAAGVIIGYFSPTFATINWIIIAMIISVFGTLGDLVESKFKRQANIKDSGKIMPGQGGLLDRLDSLFFLAPFVYLYIHFFIN